VRLDETVDFDWGTSAPLEGIDPGEFGVIWAGHVEPPADGDYQFAFVANDGGRLYLLNKLIVNASKRLDEKDATSAVIPLEAGKRYPLRAEYYNAGGTARARLYWNATNQPRGIIPRDRLFASGLSNRHAAGAIAPRGLLATYYAQPDFTGGSFTRVDGKVDFTWNEADPAPGISRDRFSVRWSGQLRAAHSEPYTFHVTADEGARLWLDGRLVLDTANYQFLFEGKETAPLTAGERYDLRLETKSSGSGATAKLHWSCPSTPKEAIPEAHLFPTRATARAGSSTAPAERIPRGVLLRHGTFLAGPVEKATDSAVRLQGLFRNKSVSTVNIARLVCQPMTPEQAARLEPGRAGLLLSKGDFVEAEFRGLDGSSLKTTSVLFGPRSYNAGRDVLAVALRDPAPEPADYELRLEDGSVLLARSVSVAPEHLLVQEPVLGAVRVPEADVKQFRHRSSARP
jgi:hypothetical protein